MEVGPGSRNFWPRASIVVDVIDRGSDDLPPGAKFIQQDICDRLPLEDKSVDFALCSHVLEHVRDPIAACAELSRVAKAGVVECPSPFTEMLFGFEGAGFDHVAYAGHEWWVWPESDGSGLVFERPNRYFSPLANRDAAGAMHRILRMGPLVGEDAMVLRRWFSRNHERWNTILRWVDNIPARISERPALAAVQV
jgi:SAM-dependent methyltransferase